MTLTSADTKQLTQFRQLLAEKGEVRLGISAAYITKSLGRISYTETEEFLLKVIRWEVLTWGAPSRRNRTRAIEVMDGLRLMP